MFHRARREEFCGVSEVVHDRLELFDDVCDRLVVLEFVLDDDSEQFRIRCLVEDENVVVIVI